LLILDHRSSCPARAARPVLILRYNSRYAHKPRCTNGPRTHTLTHLTGAQSIPTIDTMISNKYDSFLICFWFEIPIVFQNSIFSIVQYHTSPSFTSFFTSFHEAKISNTSINSKLRHTICAQGLLRPTSVRLFGHHSFTGYRSLPFEARCCPKPSDSTALDL